MSTSTYVASVGNIVTLRLIWIRSTEWNLSVAVRNTVRVVRWSVISSLRDIKYRSSCEWVFGDFRSDGTETVDQLVGVRTGGINPQTNNRVFDFLLVKFQGEIDRFIRILFSVSLDDITVILGDENGSDVDIVAVTIVDHNNVTSSGTIVNDDSDGSTSFLGN